MGRAKGGAAIIAAGKSRSSSQDSPSSRQEMELELVQEWAQADAAAPRYQCASTAADRHPDSNEDRVLCDSERGLAAVFDGMGGVSGGEYASQAACGQMADELERMPADLEGRRRWLEQTLAGSGNAVRISKSAYSEEAPSQGTTAVAALLADGKLLTASVGDSRVYRYNEEGLVKLTDDHAGLNSGLAARLDELDRVSSRETLAADPALAAMFSRRNILSDELGERRSPAAVAEHDVSPGDVVVVCSDGVHDNLTPDEIAHVIEQFRENGPDAVAAGLVEQARLRARSGHIRAKDDDITAAVLVA